MKAADIEARRMITVPVGRSLDRNSCAGRRRLRRNNTLNTTRLSTRADTSTYAAVPSIWYRFNGSIRMGAFFKKMKIAQMWIGKATTRNKSK